MALKTDYQQLPCLHLRRLLLFFLFAEFFHTTALGDVGTAAHYGPPYSPTACYGSDPTQFPSSNLFAAAGDGIWDEGASCGRQYLVKCISADVPGTCITDQTVRIIIVDHAPSAALEPSAPGKTMVLSDTAFETIAVSSVDSISIEFLQLSVMSTEA